MGVHQFFFVCRRFRQDGRQAGVGGARAAQPEHDGTTCSALFLRCARHEQALRMFGYVVCERLRVYEQIFFSEN